MHVLTIYVDEDSLPYEPICYIYSVLYISLRQRSVVTFTICEQGFETTYDRIRVTNEYPHFLMAVFDIRKAEERGLLSSTHCLIDGHITSDANQ